MLLIGYKRWRAYFIQGDIKYNPDTIVKRVIAADDTDRLLLKILSSHPKINQVELAKKVGLTQPAVSLRLRKLKTMGLISDAGVLLDISALGLEVVKVDLEVKHPAEFSEKFRQCPAVINSFVLGRNNGLCMLVAGESSQFVNCMLEKHMRQNPDVVKASSEHLITSLHGLRTQIDADRKLDAPPCGDPPCSECEYYVENGGECVGCPMTKFYRGTFWQ